MATTPQTISVAELIAALQVLPQDAPVYVDDEEGYWPARAPEAMNLAHRRSLNLFDGTYGELTRDVTGVCGDHANSQHGEPFQAVFIGSGL